MTIRNIWSKVKNTVLAVGLGLGLLVSSAQAASITYTATTFGTNNILLSGVVVYQIDISGVVGTSATFGFLDSNNTNVNYSSTSGFTNYTFTTGFITNAYTNIYGFIETNNYYPAILVTTNTTAGYTNAYPKITTLVGVTNQTISYSPVNPLYFARGVLITNNLAGVAVITYAPLK